jgi:hypothetical protein
MLSREELLSRRPKPVEVSLSGGASVFVRSFDGLEREQFEQQCRDTSDDPSLYSIRALLTVYCACTQDGLRLFTDADLPEVSKIDWIILDAIFKQAAEFNKLGDAVVAGTKN